MDSKRKRPTVEEIVALLRLKPHPEEGGFFTEVYRSNDELPAGVFDDRPSENRSLATSIFYLLTPETFSAMHRLRSDEIFHFYLGDAVTMLNLHVDGRAEILRLGTDIRNGERLQHVVPQGVWQGCFLEDGGEFALMGTTVAPGFDFRDYEAGDLTTLVREYPHSADLIRRLLPGTDIQR